MKRCDLSRERSHHVDWEFAVSRQSIEQALTIEATHLHRPFDSYAFPADAQRTIIPSDDGYDVEIDIGCSAPIDFQLVRAHRPTLFQCAEVEIRQTQGTLDLVSKIACQKDDRRMRIDTLDFSRCRIVSGRIT